MVPKKPNPAGMGDFRPIACCTVIYKCITKLLSNRILPILDSLISRNQSAFIPGRNIAENVLLAQELVRNYHRKDGKPRCTLKIDLMKAYDSVNWDFNIHCLACLGFLEKFINWIKVCITSPRFYVSLNGTLTGYFKGAKGLRQGDTLSPYLFVIAMEVLSKILKEYNSAGSGFKFHFHCSKLQLTHLCFDDDLLIFSEADLSSVSVIQAALLEFEQLSGLKANPVKSSFFCSSVSAGLKVSLLEKLQMREGHFPIRYLGVSLVSTKLSASDCKALVDKISGRIGSWTSKNLSFAGRLQLLSSVFYSLQVFWSRIFILPKKIIRDINQRFNRFLWNGKDSDSVKAKEGGLGLKNSEVWNRTPILRHIWNLFACASSIWVAWIKIYMLKGKSFWSVNIPQDCSWCRRSLLKLRSVAKNFIFFLSWRWSEYSFVV
jgi:hypothetical protein